MSTHEHLEGIEAGLHGDYLERAAIRIEDGGQESGAAMREAYRETCRRRGVIPRTEQRQMALGEVVESLEAPVGAGVNTRRVTGRQTRQDSLQSTQRKNP